MSRMKAAFAVLVMAAMTSLVPSAFGAATARVVISGSSAMWQTIALAAYNSGTCTKEGFTVKAPCFHYTDGSGAFNMTDTRPGIKQSGAPNIVDTGDLWIVWDSSTTKNVWVYLKVDSVVGNRCFFAIPACTISAPSGYGWATGGKISSALWGSDTAAPADVQSLLNAGIKVNVAATDIRPEDAAFAECRVNSVLGNGKINSGKDDGLDGLGYGTTAAGGCPAYSSTTTTTAGLVGSPIQSGLDVGVDTTVANVAAFNISGHDPFTNTAIPAYATISVGADPIVFIFSRSAAHGLNGATDITDSIAQQIFSGADCNASLFGLPSAAINAYLREPLSGTFNTTEASVFRGPIEVSGDGGSSPYVHGVSQEANVGSTNPLSNTPCKAGGGTRTRGIGTGEVVNGYKDSGGTIHGGVLGSGGSNPDGIAYTFFSFGNVSKIAGSLSYGYLTLNSQDPIGAGTVSQELPVCSAPCTEASIWGSFGTSFPALRAGNYTAWSLLRMVTNSSNKTNVQDLVNSSHTYVVNDTPDYIPAEGVPLNCTTTCMDPGIQIWHTHYQQYQSQPATPTHIGPAPNNGTFNSNHNPVTGDHGGDMGGCTISTTGITATTDLGWIQLQSTPTCSSAKVR